MKLRVLAPAQEELDGAVAWYESQAPGLSKRFLEEVRLAGRRILAHPQSWRPLGGGARQCRLSRFPYGLIYEIERHEIVIVAVAHLHREPDYWRDRLRGKD